MSESTMQPWLREILRCPACDEAVVRIARTPWGIWLDLRGAAAVVAMSANQKAQLGTLG